MLTPPQLPAVPPKEAQSLEAIVNSIPPPRCVKPTSRPFLFLAGLPGSGKSSLASRLANAYKAELVNPDTLLSALLGPSRATPEIGDLATGVEGEDATTNKGITSELFHQLRDGKEIPTKLLFEMIPKIAGSDSAQFKGLILEGMPISSLLADTTITIDEELQLFDDIVKDLPSYFRPILINLHISETDLYERRRRQLIDPVTGTIYPAAQVEYSKRKHRELNDSEERFIDLEADEENEQIEFSFRTDKSGADMVVDAKPAGEEDEEEDLDGEDEAEGVPKKGKNDVPAMKVKLSNKKTWPIIPEEVVQRLLTRPEDTDESIRQEFSNYRPKQQKLKTKANKLFDKMDIINLEATQHPDLIYKDVLNQLEVLGVSFLETPPTAKQLTPLDAGPKGLSEEEYSKILCTTQLENHEPPREVSIWGRYCPVTFIEENILQQAPLTFPVSYRGYVYFLNGEAHMLKFLANPDKYLEKPPKVPSLRICILGGPFTGKSMQSQIISQIYGITLICIDDIIADLEGNPDQQTLMKTNQLYAKIIRSCRQGRSISSEHLVELVKKHIADNVKNDSWVLDGFPRTLEDAQAMIGAGIIPQHTIILKNDINDEAVRSRQAFQQANSRTGKSWIERKILTFQPTPPSFSKPTTPNPRSTASSKFRPNSQNETKKVFEVKTIPTAPSTPEKLSPNAMPAIPILMFPYFDNLFNGFKEEFNQVIKLLEVNDTMLVNISAEQSTPTVLAVIQTAVDPFLPKATAVSAKEIEELPEKFEMGYTKTFCPFALRQANILKPGSPEFSVKYLSQYYFLSTDEARTAFMMEPHNYINFRTPMKAPPPRLLFFGPTGSGKAKCMESLANWGAPVVNFTDVIFEFAKKADEKVRDEIHYMMKENAGNLSPVIVEDIITFMFTDEPYSSKGFIMHGFPRTKVEAEVLLKHNLFMDAFVHLKIESDVAAKRAFGDTRKAGMEQLEQARYEHETKGEIAKPQLVEAEKAIAKLETEKTAQIDELVDLIEKENLRISEVLGTLESMNSVPIIEIDANHCERPVMATLRRKLRPYFDYRQSIFSNAVAIEPRMAETLLELGIKSLSPFKKLCPVSYYKETCPLIRTSGDQAALYRDYIYFLRDQSTREEFLLNTLTYVQQAPPKPVVRPRIAIIGKPKSGKSLVAAKLAEDYKAVLLSIPIILESILQGQERTELAGLIASSLHSGQDLPESAINEAVAVVTSRGVCQARGWILDGYPWSMPQVQHLEDQKVVPNIIFELDLESSIMLSRAHEDFAHDVMTNTPRLNYDDIVYARSDLYLKDLRQIRDFYTARYDNWIRVDASMSKWATKCEFKKVIERGTVKRQNYFQLRSTGKAAPVANVGLDLGYIADHMAKFGEYSPVSLLDKGELKAAPAEVIVYTAEYQNEFYRMVDEGELNAFLECPERYAYAPDLPDSLPERRDSSALVFPKQLELQGYCPVTFAEDPSNPDNIVEGSKNLLVEYESKLYAFETEEKRELFMKKPWDYATIQLPKTLPPKAIPIPVNQLPLTGFLEQTVAKAITAALVEVGRARPKHPFKDLEISASEFIALYLKANNPNLKEWVRKSYDQRLRKFKSHCGLINEITTTVSKTDRKFIAQKDREAGLDQRINDFFTLSS